MSLYCHKNSIGNFYKRRGIIKKTEGQRQQRLKIKDQEAGRRRGRFYELPKKGKRGPENVPRAHHPGCLRRGAPCRLGHWPLKRGTGTGGPCPPGQWLSCSA